MSTIALCHEGTMRRHLGLETSWPPLLPLGPNLTFPGCGGGIPLGTGSAHGVPPSGVLSEASSTGHTGWRFGAGRTWAIL